MADLKVVRNELDGWDVVRADEDIAIANFPTREQAEEAAHMRAREESLSEEDEGDVIVDTEHTHGIDSERQGVRTAFLALAGLLALITLIAVILALTGSLTDFGA